MSIVRGLLIFLVLTCSNHNAIAAPEPLIPARHAVVLNIKGAIGPSTRDYIERSLAKAQQRNALFVVIQIDTPGGLDSSMRDIIQAILASPIPVVTYVTPSGARAASAGTYIIYASHIAAMAPATTLGAATPVQIGGIGTPPNPKNVSPEEAKKKSNDDAMKRKIINDAVAFIQGLAELRGRNAKWAELAVREAASLNAKEALAKNVIDLIAVDISELIKNIHNRKLHVLGQDKVFDTTGLTLRYIEPDWRSRLLSIITNPNVAYILMLIGIYGLIFEFANPGAILPGIAGAICLLLALYAFQVLPVNYAGLALILLGVMLMVGEAFVPSFGALGMGGIIAFVIGSIIMMDTDVPGFGVSLPLIISFSVISSAIFTFVLVMALKARRRPVVSGQEELVGALATATMDFSDSGRVNLHGESWLANTDQQIRKGQKLRVTAVEGLTLIVTPDTVLDREHKQ